MDKLGIFVLTILVGSALGAVLPVHSPAQPVWPATYTVSGVIMLPYAEILEPFEAWFDRPENRSRIDYYNGMVKTIQRGDLSDFGEMLKIAPVANETNHYSQVCFGVNGTHDGPVGPQNVLPEMSNYTYDGMRPCEYADGDCEAWLFEDPEGDNKINRFLMLVQRYGDSNVVPRAYEMQGYDTLFGSHFDKYIIVYNEMTIAMPDASVFQPPNGVDCSNPSPTPGSGRGNAQHRHALSRVSLNPMQEFIHNTRHHVVAAFDDFKTRHNKTYATDTKEHHIRKFNFLNNFRFIESTNRKGLSYRLAVNHMTDMSDDERRAMRGYVRSGKRNSGLPLPNFSSLFTNFAVLGGAAEPVRPTSWDWRIQGAVTPVKDQAICGSCWTYGTTGAIEGANFVKTGKLVVLSQQSLIDCSWAYGNNGCDGGEEEQAYDWIMKNGGIMSTYDYGKYLGQDGYCHHDPNKVSVKLAGYYNVTSGDTQKLEDTIMLIGPTAVNIDASHKSFSYYANGVYDDAECKSDPYSLDHSVLAVGFGELKGQRYWLIKNSWSTYYGNDGYVLIAQKDNRCGVATQATAVKIAA